MRAAAVPFAVLLFAVLAHASAAGATFPPLTGRVVDAAGILSESTRSELTGLLEAHERATGQQIVVATIPDLGDEEIADYGYQLGRAWGIGGKEHDTGVLLVVAPAQRKVRIEVGYGLEGDLTDAMSSNIIQTRILPEFRKGDYDAGVRAGVRAIIGVLGGTADAMPQRVRHGIPVGVFWLIVLLIVLSRFGRFGGRGGGGLARAIVWGSVLGGMSGGRGGGGGFHGGGGGFHGGGGSFGGGGASGSW
jgi:uncharacterized protein